MEYKSTIYEGVSIECFGNFDEPDETTGYKGGWKTCKVLHNCEDITTLISESTLEQIDEQIAQEY